MIALLQNYDQPMILLGLVGMVATAGFLIHAMIEREENAFDTVRYKLAFMRTPKLVAGLILAALIFATGWAIPNPPKPVAPPPTFASLYQDCMYSKTRDDENINACIKHANTVLQK